MTEVTFNTLSVYIAISINAFFVGLGTATAQWFFSYIKERAKRRNKQRKVKK